MASKAQESRELTKMNDDMSKLVSKMKLGKELTDAEKSRVAAHYTFGYIQFKLLEKQFKDYTSTVKTYLKDHGKSWNAPFELIRLDWELRSRGKTMDQEWAIENILKEHGMEGLKTVLLNSKISFDKKTLGVFLSQDEIDAHSKESFTEYLVPKKKKDINDDEPKAIRTNSNFVKDLMNNPRMLLKEG